MGSRHCGNSFSGVGIALSNTGNGSLTWSQPGGSGFSLAPSSGRLNAGASIPVSLSGTKSNASFKISWQDGGQGSTNSVIVSVSCVPVIVNFYMAPPTSASYDCNSNPGAPPLGARFTLDNTGSNIDVGWQLTVNDPPGFVQAYGSSWVSPSASQRVVAAGATAQVFLKPFTDPITGNGVCTAEGNSPYPFTVTVTSGGSGSYTFTYYITGLPPVLF